MTQMVKKFDAQAPQITPWKKRLLASAEVAFYKGTKLADNHEQEVLELRVNVDHPKLDNNFIQ